jgi:hypothetical protein
MRTLFLLLVLANLLFLAYAHVAREGANAESQVSQLQMSPEKVKLLKSAGQPVVESPKAPPGKAIPPALPKELAPIPAACIEWGLFAGPAVARAEAALAKLGLTEGRVERAVADAGGYWVYMPPLKTKPEIDKKIAELKKLNVTEFFVVQDAGQWKNAISLGIFRTDEAAQAYLAKLKEQGVRSAVSTRREGFLKQFAFYVREPDEATVARVTALQQEFPGSEVKAGACPTPAVAAKG